MAGFRLTSPQWLKTAGLCVLSAACMTALLGAARSNRPAGTRMALVDLKYLFKNHVGFDKRSAEMKTAVMLAEADINLQKQHVQELQKKLAAVADREQAKALQAEIAEATVRLQAQVTLQRSEFLQREADIYSKIYREITAEIEKYRLEHGIDVVIRFNSEKLKGDEDPEAVTAMLNKPVVSTAPELDITKAIQERLNSPDDEKSTE